MALKGLVQSLVSRSHALQILAAFPNATKIFKEITESFGF